MMRNVPFSNNRIVPLAIVVVLGLGNFTQVDAGSISSLFAIEATNDLGTATFEVGPDAAERTADSWNWSLDEPIDFFDENDEFIATLQTASVVAIGDPQVSLNFAVTSGPLNTTFTLTSALLNFAPISPAQGRASAGITVTEGNGNAASLTGLFAGGTKSYQATYNGGTTFAELINNDSTSEAFGTFTSSEALPGSGFTSIAGSVSSMQSAFSFTLSALDSASGTSIFVTIPEPSSLTLVMVGFMMLSGSVRRRR